MKSAETEPTRSIGEQAGLTLSVDGHRPSARANGDNVAPPPVIEGARPHKMRQRPAISPIFYPYSGSILMLRTLIDRRIDEARRQVRTAQGRGRRRSDLRSLKRPPQADRTASKPTPHVGRSVLARSRDRLARSPAIGAAKTPMSVRL